MDIAAVLHTHQKRSTVNLVKGAQKRMIVLRTPGSALYEQAYFVLRDDRAALPSDEHSLITEANRILHENLLPTQRSNGRKRQGTLRWLLLGALAGAAVAVALCLLLLY